MLYRTKKAQLTKACFDSIARAKKAGMYGTSLEICPHNVTTVSGLVKSDQESRRLLTDVARRLRKNGVRTYIFPAMINNICCYPDTKVSDDGESIGIAGFDFEEDALDIYETFGEWGLRLYFKKCGYWLVMEWD